MRRSVLACVALAMAAGVTACSHRAVRRTRAAAKCDRNKIPIIVVTDLYYPPEDPGDNFDLLTAYALPEVDLKAVVLDCTEVFRQPVATNPGRGLYPDPNGPRDPGFIPVWQLNYIFNRNVPCATGPFTRMKSPSDKMLDVPGFQQQGVRLMLHILQASRRPVEILSFGSARPIAVAFNRDPALFKKKVAQIYLNAGATAPDYLEWNVALDTNAIVCLLRSHLPIALFPCAANNSRGVGYGVHSPAHSYDSHNTYYKLPNLKFVERMQPQLRRYLEFALARSDRMDFLRAMDRGSAVRIDPSVLSKEHYVWETASWICATRSRLVRRADGHYRIVPPGQLKPGDVVLPNELHPCCVTVRDDGIYFFAETNGPSNFKIYYRGDPRQNERALREALPELYRSFPP